MLNYYNRLSTQKKRSPSPFFVHIYMPLRGPPLPHQCNAICTRKLRNASSRIIHHHLSSMHVFNKYAYLKLSFHTTGRNTMEAFHRIRIASMSARGNFQMPKMLPITAQALSQIARKATEKKW